MKMTLTIDDDVLAALEQLRRDHNATLEEVVSERRCAAACAKWKRSRNRANYFERCQWIAAHR